MWCLFSRRDAHIHRKYRHWDAHIHVNIVRDSWFLFDFPVISLKNDVICCKSGWGWRVGLISGLDFKEICLGFSWFQLDSTDFSMRCTRFLSLPTPRCGRILPVLELSFQTAKIGCQVCTSEYHCQETSWTSGARVGRMTAKTVQTAKSCCNFTKINVNKTAQISCGSHASLNLWLVRIPKQQT